MTALTATARAAGDGVDLVVTGAPAGAVTITRRDGNGVRPVRGPLLYGPAGTVRVTDWEGALVGRVRYLVIDAAGAQALADVVMPATALPQWRRTNRPDVAFTLVPDELVLVVQSDQALRVSEHEAIGRADVVFTTYLLGLRRGTIEVLVTSYERALDLARVYADGKVVRLRQPTHPGLDMHHLGLGVAIAPDSQDKSRFTVSLRFAEVRPPLTDALPAWSVGLLAGAFDTIAAVSLAYDTVADLAVDERAGQ